MIRLYYRDKATGQQGEVVGVGGVVHHTPGRLAGGGFGGRGR